MDEIIFYHSKTKVADSIPTAVKLLFSLPVVEISQNEHHQKLLRMFEHLVGKKAFSNGRTLLAQHNPTIFNEILYSLVNILKRGFSISTKLANSSKRYKK